MKNLTPLFITILPAALPLLAAEPDLTRLPPAADKKNVTYAADIRPLLEASCFRCHGEERPKHGLRLDSLEAVLKGSEDGKVIVPGKSKESPLVIAVAQLDEETAMPPKRKPGGPGGAGGRGGAGGFGGGGFGRGALAQQMLVQGDKDKDQALSKAEFTGLAETWFDKMDSSKAGKLSQEQFTGKFSEVLGLSQTNTVVGRDVAQRAGGQGGGRGPAGGPTSFIGTGLFTAADIDKDGSVTRAELKTTFGKWFTDWDSEKGGALNEEKLSAGLRAVLPQQGFGGFGGTGGRSQAGPGGAGGPGAFGGGGGGPAAKPLTTEQVGLVRAWIDQGAK